MAKIFLCYRRTNSQSAERICDRLVDYFGRDAIFKDIGKIRPGEDFRRALEEALAACGIVLAVIGKRWLGQRLANEGDFVRIELERALQREITIIPILVDGAKMPRPEQLPPNVRELAFRQAVVVRGDPDFDRDIADLSAWLEQSLRDIDHRGEAAAADDVPMHGVVPREALKTGRLAGELFAAELLTRDIVVEKEGRDEEVTIIHVDRDDVDEVVISSPGKTHLVDRFVAPRQRSLLEQDQELYDFIVTAAPGASRVLRLENLPMRWASGGVVSIVSFRKRKWIPLFFRDIRPYGWNISLGSSERYFDSKRNVVGGWDEELLYPLRFICREFLEETLVLQKTPQVGECECRPFVLPFGDWSDAQQKRLQLQNDHVRLRDEQDGLKIRGNRDLIHTHAKEAKMTLVVRKGHAGSWTGDVIVCLNLLELGIEVVKAVTYALDEENQMLDGEVLDREPQELTRMPVALISCSYLQKAFGGPRSSFNYTPGAQPSIVTERPIPGDDIHLFDWDLHQRLAIIRGDKPPFGKERERYLDWYDKFGANFVDRQGKPTNRAAPRLFTPATVKVLNMCFAQIDPKVFD